LTLTLTFAWLAARLVPLTAATFVAAATATRFARGFCPDR
jgi:hypothetical protein